MRVLVLVSIAATLIFGVYFVAPATVDAVSATVSAAQTQPTGDLDVDVDIGGGEAWYANPLWIGLGVLALIVIVALVALGRRGGGTPAA